MGWAAGVATSLAVGFCGKSLAGPDATHGQASDTDEADYIVIGGGVMGLATTWRVASAGKRVICLDASHPIRGSWGESRASHLTIEDGCLLRMGLSSQNEWLALQKDYIEHGHRGQGGSGPSSDADAAAAATVAASPWHPRSFYLRVGRVTAGPIGTLAGTLEAIRREVPGADDELADPPVVEELSAVELAGRVPQIGLVPGVEEAIFMPRDGFIMCASAALDALAWAARRAGAVIKEDEQVVGVDLTSRTVTTASGATYRYGRKLLVAAGPWTNQVLESGGLAPLPLVVSNEQTIDFGERDGWNSSTSPDGTGSNPGYSTADGMPLLSWSNAGYKGKAASGQTRYFYCVPTVAVVSEPGAEGRKTVVEHQSSTAGFKIGYHRMGPLMDNDEFRVSPAGRAGVGARHQRPGFSSAQSFEADPLALQATQEFVTHTLPGLDPSKINLLCRCLYQNTPDIQMMLGRHPSACDTKVADDVVVMCGFSGRYGLAGCRCGLLVETWRLLYCIFSFNPFAFASFV